MSRSARLARRLLGGALGLALGAAALGSATLGAGACNGPCGPGKTQICNWTENACACASPCDAAGECPAGLYCMSISDTEQVCVEARLYRVECRFEDQPYSCYQSFCQKGGGCAELCETSAECESGCCTTAEGVFGAREVSPRVCWLDPAEGGVCLP